MEPLYAITQFGFVATTLLFFGLVIFQLKKALNKSSFEPYIQKRIIYLVIGYLLLWMIVLSGLSLSGFFSKFDTMPPDRKSVV